MWFVRFACAALLLALTSGATVVRGQAPGGAAAQPPEAASAPTGQAETSGPELTPDIDREAERVLRAMAATLDKAQRFALDAEEVFHEIPDAGPRRSLTSVRRIAIERPDRVVADVTGEAANRTVWFDRGHLTVLDKQQNVYAAIEAPKTVHEMLDWAAKEYGIDVPLSDLFYPDLYAVLMDGVIRGEYLGLQSVEGVSCHHLAFEQETIDWQLWIDARSSALPRKLSISYKTEVGEPQYTVFLRSWNLAPTFPAEVFQFQAPDGAKRIELDRVLGSETAAASSDISPASTSSTPPEQEDAP
jgi:hypothetical protein